MYIHDHLVKTLDDDVMCAAAQSRLAPHTRRTNRPPCHRPIAGPVARLALTRLREAAA
jgi:hypothetical protein